METLTPPDKDSTAQAETTQSMGGNDYLALTREHAPLV